MEVTAEVKAVRTPEYPVDGLFLNRWSPRAFLNEPVEEATLRSVFEAARWAPSSMNEQPWRYVFARSAEDRARVVECLMPMNQAWAKDAPVLLVAITKKTMYSGQANPTAEFDTGTSWGHLSIAAVQHGLITHGMAGFFKEKIQAALSIPADFVPQAVIALGKRGDVSKLPEAYRPRERPSNRRPQTESFFEGTFTGPAQASAPVP